MAKDVWQPEIREKRLVLEKYEGEALPENLIERIVMEDGVIVEQEFFDKEVT